MKQPPRQRTIKDERDEKIGKDAKSLCLWMDNSYYPSINDNVHNKGKSGMERNNIDIIFWRCIFTVLWI